VLLGLYPAPLLDGLHYNASNLIFNYNFIYLSVEICNYIAETTLNSIFELFKYNIWQATYIATDEYLYSILKDYLDNSTEYYLIDTEQEGLVDKSRIA